MNIKILFNVIKKYNFEGILLLLLFFINFYWFYKMGLRYHVLMGDDLSAWNSYKENNSFFSMTLFNTGADKYRPFWNIIQFTLFKLFGNEFHLFFLLNILFNFIIVFYLFRLIKTVGNNNVFVAFFLCLIYITSRFAYYNLLQLNGLMEASCILLLIWILHNSFQFYKSANPILGYKIIVYFFIIIFIHERFASLLPFICIVFFFNKLITSKMKAFLISTPIVIILFNFFMKTVVFHTHIMVGTGGTNVSINLKSIFIFFACGILNLLGFNVGPPYLNGVLFQNSSSYVQLFSFLICIIVLASIFLFIKKDKFKNKENLLVTLLALILICLLLFPAILTIRLELRWLYSPFVVLLVYFAYIFARINTRAVVCLLAILTFLSLANNVYYKKNESNVFFIRAQQISETVYEETIKRYGTKLVDYDIYIIKHNEFDWPLLGPTFFKQFGLEKKLTVKYVDRVEDIKGSTDKMIVLYFNNQTQKVENITNEVKYNTDKINNQGLIIYDFLKNFDKGKILPKDIPVSTPNGKGVMLLDWNIGGKKEGTLTILSGFQYKYERLSVQPNSKLQFSLFNPFKTGDGYRFFIELKNGNKVTRIFEKDITAPFEENDNLIKFYSLQLSNIEQTSDIDISFGVESPSGDNTSDWLAIRELTITN